MSNISKRRKEGSRTKIKSMGDHTEFLKRITKTLYYGQLPSLPCLSLPVTEISCEVWSAVQRGRSVRRLHADCAAGVSRAACVSPAALVLALLYMERLRTACPDYLNNTPPADLFLVTLMVGNKFLQDDGEDEEVLCSEWASSGGLDLRHMRRLELQFLNAIDWNVFVNEESFERCLRWLERRVALKQARLRGFFTYGDLAAALAGGDILSEMARAACEASVTCVAGLLALVASALLVSAACLPVYRLLLLSPASTPPPPQTTAASTLAADFPALPTPLAQTQYIPNSTIDEITLDAPSLSERRCCTEWIKYQENTKNNWFDMKFVCEWKSIEPWWSRTSVLNWLYQSSLVSPLQRWLERVNEYVDLIATELGTDPTVDKCRPYDKSTSHSDTHKCVRQWLNLSKLSALMVSVTDR